MSDSEHITLDIDKARQSILALEEMDLLTADIEDLLILLTPVLRGYITSAPRFKPGIDLFRGVPWAEKPIHKDQISYPPSKVVTKLGRVNRIGQASFYCATAREVPFFELDLNAGQTLVISQWKTTSSMLVNHVGYTADVFQSQASNRKNPHWGGQPQSSQVSSANQVIDEFLARTFTRRIEQGQEHLYKLSIAIGEKLCADELFDGLLYPTMAMRANADNIALKPRYVDSSLEFVKAEFIRYCPSFSLMDIIPPARRTRVCALTIDPEIVLALDKTTIRLLSTHDR